MDLTHFIAQVVFATVALAFVVTLSVRAVRFAKRGTAGAQVLGAGFMLLSGGNIRDPDNELVEQAKQLKQRDEDDSGDPPNPDDRGGGK